jgi:hypothetical protein
MSVGMALLATLAPAAAAESWWAGEWGVDPSRSDEATQAIERAYIGPTLTAGPAQPFSPDGGGDVDVDASKRKLLYKLMAVLGRSGRLSLAEEPDGAVRLGYGDSDALRLELGNKWTRVADQDGDKYKIRVRAEDDWLMMERKVSGTVVTETVVAPKEPGELVVVVTVVGSELDSGIEFRRVYRRL